MPSSYTSSLRLTLPATGELTGTWGTTVNDGITTLLDNAVAGAATITMTAADYTLTTSNGATDEARAKILILTGTPGAARNVICPAVSKTYIVYNNTTGGFAQTIKTSAGTGISVPNGKTKIVRCDGTNVVEGFDAAGSVDLTGNLSYTGTLTGGTGIVNLGSGQFYKDASGNIGVGTTSPDAASLIGRNLTIYQNTSAGNVSDNAAIVVQSVNRNATISLRGSSTSANSYSFSDQTASYAGIVGDTANQALFFRSGGTTERMRLDSSGNLGIGTASPGVKLDVSGPIRSSSAVSAGYASGFDQTYINSNGATGNGCVMATVNYANSAYQPITYDANLYIWRPNGTERMRFDATGNLGIGVTPMATGANGAQLQIGSPTVTSGAGLTIGCTTTADIQFSDATSGTGQYAGLIRYSHANDSMGFWTASSVRATIDSSGNLGIGTSSPGAKLDVRGAGLFLLSGAGSTTPLVLRNDTGGGTTQLVKLGFDSNGAIKASINAAVWNNDYMTFNVGSDTERMRLDSLGNLAIGTTPAAWLTGGNLQLPGNIAFNGAFSIGANAYFGSGSAFRYISSNPASLYQQASGQHIWQSAASGTATNTISFQQTMVLDANGLLSLTGTAGQANWRKFSTDTAPYYHAFIKSRGTSAVQTTVVLGDAIGSTQFYAFNGTNEQAAASIVGRVASTGTVSATSMPGQLDFYTTPDGSNSPLLRATLDSSGNLGIGTSSPTGGRLHVAVGTGTATYSTTSGGGGWGGHFINTDGGINSFVRAAGVGGNGVFSAGVGATTQLFLDTSGNLGIGTSSPGAKLDVRGNATFTGNATARQTADFTNTGGQLYVGAESSAGGAVFTGSSAYAGVLGTNTNTVLQLATNGAVRATLDSSGNLGLGVTPSAWLGAGYIDFPGNGYVGNAASYSGNTLSTGLNAYYGSGDWRYKASSLAASRFDHTNGAFAWYTAPSGTAGTAISFTQAMTLDVSGNLLAGVTTQIYPSANRRTVEVNGTSQALFGLGVGGTAAGFLLHDGADMSLYQTRAGVLVFGTNNTERARITSGGDLLVGLTAQVTSELFSLKKANGTNHVQRVWNASTTGDNAFVVFTTETTATDRGGITYNRAGGLTSYNTTSDYRAKDIIGPVQDPGATIDALKVYEGKMKGATQSRPMLVAHEAQEHAPYAVSGVKDEVNEDGTPKFQQMDVSSLVPLLLAEIQSLRVRVAQLEAKV